MIVRLLPRRLRERLNQAQPADTAPADGLAANGFARRALVIAAVLLLSVPSALGVQRALAPTRGFEGATLAAIGFELLYLGTALLTLNAALRTYAQRTALAAVLTAIVLNIIADYSTRIPGGLASWSAAQRLFDPLALGLSVLESAPLAGLAYAGATLLHRLSEATAHAAEATVRERAALAQLRTELAQLHAEVAQLAQERDAASDRAAQAAAEIAQLRAELVRRHAEAEQVRASAVQAGTDAAQLRADLDAARAALAQRDQQLAQVRADASRQAEELAQLRANPPATSDLDLAAIAEALRASREHSWREIEGLLGVPQSTLRGWLTRRNGTASVAHVE